ncbi:MAG: threonylcarbamoyl-AMP synthase [Paraprevotella sp.]|jgi:tRNA threonylcarbamoyl adenosine modification protein (Sua5/YciO/YrdC/YwlC family)|nr:threonylcarbamoyl-AMP synthase [Paraprevotella sp.]
MLTKIYAENPNEREMGKAIRLLQEGELIVYPTDTLYAIGCDALNVRAVEKLCALKGLNPLKADLSIVCYDLSNISEYAQVSNGVFKVLKKNLPGPFTFILPTSSRLPKLYKNKKEVGIRVPDNNIARGLVAGLGNPILSMSVRDDEEQAEYTTDPELIHEKYNKKVALVIDAGFGGDVPSTVVNCVDDELEVIREGKGILKI